MIFLACNLDESILDLSLIELYWMDFLQLNVPWNDVCNKCPNAAKPKMVWFLKYKHKKIISKMGHGSQFGHTLSKKKSIPICALTSVLIVIAVSEGISQRQ